MSKLLLIKIISHWSTKTTNEQIRGQFNNTHYLKVIEAKLKQKQTEELIIKN
jgi:hypothetical protein